MRSHLRPTYMKDSSGNVIKQAYLGSAIFL